MSGHVGSVVVEVSLLLYEIQCERGVKSSKVWMDVGLLEEEDLSGCRAGFEASQLGVPAQVYM